MGNKKRNSSAVEDEAQLPVDDTATENAVVSKKKLKKTKPQDDTKEDVAASVKPMERKKKRKAMDKDRHRTALEEKESSSQQPELMQKPAVAAASSSSSGKPEFHIGVFKDLASADASKRKEAAETLMIELHEVQKAYDGSGEESEVKLEAEKDDGLNECAPSLRYAVRRLIRGVSSSREVHLFCLIILYVL